MYVYVAREKPATRQEEENSQKKPYCVYDLYSQTSTRTVCICILILIIQTTTVSETVA